MISPLVVLALQVAQAAAPAALPVRDTAMYATPQLRAIVGEAARYNRRVPAGLGSYRATMESEISIGSQRPDQGEESFSVEQVVSELTWARTGAFDQRIVGYRAQSAALQFATIGFYRNAWAVPSLYGNRLALLFGRDTNSQGVIKDGMRDDRATIYAVHPLASDRDRIYRFRGGDTVQVMRFNDRLIPIIRIDVEPRTDVPDATVVFSGELDLDATRKHLVRMRGYFATLNDPRAKRRLAGRVRLQGIAFVELVNSEIDEAFWLPSYERFEVQATAPYIGQTRALFRIVSRVRGYEITAPNGTTVGVTPPVDTMQLTDHRLSVASRDSLTHFTGWHDEIGVMSSAVTGTDFDDVAPDIWRATGPPKTSLRTERINDVVHVNRIEGVWTGLGITREFRGQAPGVTVRAIGGYAWSERTVRGRAVAEYDVARMRYAVRAGRSLDITNDFRIAFDSGSALSAIVGADDYDYVDRTSAMVSAARLTPGRYGSALRIDFGFVEDRNAHVSMTRSLIGRSLFPANRPVREGRYARTSFTLNWRPDISGDLMRTGIGGRFYYERGDGDLNYQRVEARAATRWNHGAVTIAARADIGQVFGDVIPPQQMFELGRSEALPGYGYKELAGDQAVLVRGMVMYRLPIGNAPVRITKRIWLPDATPALAMGLQAGWTGVSNESARVAMLLLNGAVDPGTPAAYRPGSRASEGVRATATIGVRFFGGAVGILFAKPLDQQGHGRVMLSIGQQL